MNHRLPPAIVSVCMLAAGAAANPSPVLLRIAPTGVAGEGCANNDGPAVEFVFKVKDELPTIAQKDADVSKPALTYGPPLVGNQELHVRVNATLARVSALRQWTVSKPDSDGGLLAWVCPAGGYPCDFATTGTVTFTRANSESIDGQADLTFQSKNVVRGRLSAKLAPRARPVMCG